MAQVPRHQLKGILFIYSINLNYFTFTHSNSTSNATEMNSMIEQSPSSERFAAKANVMAKISRLHKIPKYLLSHPTM